MTDSEKLALIDKIIADFWEMNTTEEQANGAASLVVVISSVVRFEGKEKE